MFTWKMLATMAIVMIAVGVSPKCAFACSCRTPPPPAEALANATAVFSGRVTVVDAPADAGGPMPTTVVFTVFQSWKGSKQSILSIATPSSSASCGVDFVKGQDYLVYAYNVDGQLQTTLCNRTTPLTMAGADLAALGAGQIIATPGLPATGISAPIIDIRSGTLVGGVLLAIGSVLVFTQRRRHGHHS